MIRPEQDVERRMPVWGQLQMLFMDTDPHDFLDEIAEVCARSPYGLDEIEAILFNEVLPACRFNLLSVAGEWRGIDAGWLKNRILEKHRFGKRRPWLSRRYTTTWWRKLEPRILALRGESRPP